MNKKIIVLGKSGMLGSMLDEYLKSNPDLVVKGMKRDEFDAEQFLCTPEKYQLVKEYDYIVNCIGIIKPYCKDDDEVGVQRAIKVNALFPHLLADYLKGSKTKVIQIATDCVYTGNDGGYDESASHDATDVYGKTKSLGEANGNPNFLNIRCSIIGPEMKNYVSLLEWFLHQPEKSILNGFSHHKWNGVTTLQFAKLCERIMVNDEFDKLTAKATTLHFAPNSTVTKYELLQIFVRVFKRDVEVEEVNDIGPAVDRTISSKYKLLVDLYPKMMMEKAIVELANYMKVQ